MSVNHVIEDNPILKSALENLGEEKAIAIKPIAILGESSSYEFNYVVHMDNYIHLPRRQKKMAASFDTAIKGGGFYAKDNPTSHTDGNIF